MCMNDSKSAKTCCNPCLFTNVLNTSTAFTHETWDTLEWQSQKQAASMLQWADVYFPIKVGGEQANKQNKTNHTTTKGGAFRHFQTSIRSCRGDGTLMRLQTWGRACFLETKVIYTVFWCCHSLIKAGDYFLLIAKVPWTPSKVFCWLCSRPALIPGVIAVTHLRKVGKDLCETAEGCFTGAFSLCSSSCFWSQSPALSVPELLCIGAWPCTSDQELNLLTWLTGPGSSEKGV